MFVKINKISDYGRRKSSLSTLRRNKSGGIQMMIPSKKKFVCENFAKVGSIDFLKERMKKVILYTNAAEQK